MVQNIFETYDKTQTYVVFIDSSYPCGIQWRIYDMYFEAMRSAGLDVHRFKFRQDIRYCISEDYEVIGFKMALKRFNAENTSIIIFSSGEGFFNSGKLRCYEWLNDLFEGYRQPILVTPIHYNQWSRVEYELDKAFFALVFYDEEGLKVMGEQLKRSCKDNDLFEMSYNSPLGCKSYIGIKDDTNISKFLRFYYKHNMLKWIYQCALMDLFGLDGVIGIGRDIIGDEDMIPHLIQLCRLPWFRQGWIPEDYRQKILESDWNK